ncbi:MAG TPA: ABC transporter permease [Gemmataceae bacterium]|nr:ABC transporter permease [Gemmataceae bacterium]
MPLLGPLEQLGQFAYFGFRAVLAAPTSFVRPRELVRQLYAILIGALPLGLAAGGALGAVVWMHLRGALVTVGGPGAATYLPQAQALAVVLEFAPLGAGLIVAGRSGASLGAELGSMRLTEQIDALEVLGLSPLRELVGPRVLACMLALPPLTVFIAYLAILSGYVAEAIGGNMTLTEYKNATLGVLYPSDVIPAVLKTVAFGYLIGVTGCYFGMAATGGTEGVGRAATRSVVTSIFLVLVSNVFLVKLIQVVNG